MGKHWVSLLSMTVCAVVMATVALADDEADDSQATGRLSGGKFRLERSRRSASWALSGQPRYTARSTRTFSADEIDAFNQGLHRKRPKFIGKRQAVETSTGNRGDLGHAMTSSSPEVVAAMAAARLRQLVDEADSKPEEEMVDQPWSEDQKRSAARKFVGRRSSAADGGTGSSGASDEDGSPLSPVDTELSKRSNAASGAPAPRRKFVGKRNRKFVGRRSQNGGFPSRHGGADAATSDDDVIENDLRRAKARELLVEKLLADEMLAAAGNDQSERSDDKRAGRKFVG